MQLLQTRSALMGTAAAFSIFALMSIPTAHSIVLADSVTWQFGPCSGDLGGIATISVPTNFAFAGGPEAAKYMEQCHNLPHPALKGVVRPQKGGSWHLSFEYLDIGHVPDDEKQSLDAAAILREKQIRQISANEQLRRRGWEALHPIEWLSPPAYEADTKRLSWSLRLTKEAPATGEVCNYNVRLLGRTGVMSVTLACDPREAKALLPQVKSLLAGYEFTSGQSYGEWRVGDKVAAYGLTGLITGGGAAALTKSGLIPKLTSAPKVGAAVSKSIIAPKAGAAVAKPAAQTGRAIGKGVAAAVAAVCGFLGWLASQMFRGRPPSSE